MEIERSDSAKGLMDLEINVGRLNEHEPEAFSKLASVKLGRA